MSHLEWLRSIVDTVNQKHQNQANQSPVKHSTLGKSQASFEQEPAQDSFSFQETEATDELEQLYQKGLKGIKEPSFVLRNIKLYDAKPYSFYHTYPAFDQLDLKQLRWYLYWRQLVQQGIYADTKESYMFLYAFELLNLSFEPNPEKAIAMLIELYDAYKERVPRIAATVPTWIGDMHTEFGDPATASSWYERTKPQHLQTSMFEAYEETDIVPPFSLWKPLLNEQTAFYKKHGRALDECAAFLMEPLDEYFRKKQGKSLLQVLLPEKWVVEQARFYEWAVIERPVPFRRKVTYAPQYKGKHSSLEQLAACLRYLENHFRKEANVRPIQVDETYLPKPLQAVLDQVFQAYRKSRPQSRQLPSTKQNVLPKQMPVKDIHIDTAMIQSLHEESDRIRDTILAMEETSDQELTGFESPHSERRFDDESLPATAAGSAPRPLPKPETETVKELSRLFQNPVFSAEPLYTLSEWMEELADNERELINWWIGQSAQMLKESVVQGFVRSQGWMLHSLLDAINEKALECFGDILFEVDGGEIAWNPECIQEPLFD
ncbi:TerB N-terminal domain-containing protein [Fodinisporobacter ferrooxydans]|uniref:TerB N-terminal domain-containing protein n=1 Tax=Fodinisporobacter ferrooxydans TaxID=2901836 RepID=A0ABY4CNT1_9BACL|nr:TerB N-terminal domain-containing protein [Alicyclobacillaceae bacterium MYW30-H2]